MTRAVIYARFSSQLQREASIVDQVEVCLRYAVTQGWSIIETYADAAISGASRFRPSFQKLIADAGQRRFDIVICEAIDRLGRRLADTADLQDQLSFHGIRLFTPAVGELTPIHVAVMGMMAQMALKDLGDKTKRGQLGRVLKGRVAGGLAYGYRVDGSQDGGARTIEPDEASIINRIFCDFGAGTSPEAIAKQLNREGVAGPGGRPWSNTTLRGQAARGTGLLNNALYRGSMHWNRCSYVKDPRTGKRVARPNSPDQWEVQSVPNLRIVDDALWAKVKARQDIVRPAPPIHGQEAKRGGEHLNASHRARFLLSGRLRCGGCGGEYTIIGKDRYGCATRSQKGTCDNGRTIDRHALERRVFVGFKDKLLSADLIAEAVCAAQQALKVQQRERGAALAKGEKKVAEFDRRIAGMLRAVEDGFYEPTMKVRLAELRSEKDTLTNDEAAAPDITLKLLLRPDLPDLYRRRVDSLEAVLDGPDRAEAMELIRATIDRITLTPCPNAKGLDAVLEGDLAVILSTCIETSNAKPPGALRATGGQVSVVAGAGFEPAAFRL